MKEGDLDARPGSGGKNRTKALAIAVLFAGATAVSVWLIADDAGLTMRDTVTPALMGGAIGLVLAVIVLVLAMSPFRTLFSRMRTPGVLLLAGFGLWARLLLEPRAQIGLFVGLGAWAFFIILGLALDPRLTRRSEQHRALAVRDPPAWKNHRPLHTFVRILRRRVRRKEAERHEATLARHPSFTDCDQPAPRLLRVR